jgi:ABC-type glycerol-3-phosphate transport system substrate-binding protein
VRRLALLLTALALAGCGGSSTQTTTTNAAAPPGPGTTLYAGGDWAVVLHGDEATAFHRVAGTWNADTSGAVKIAILGPNPGDAVASIPQLAAELSAKKPLIESGIWVDGREMPVKGGGLAPTKGTIYGALGAPLTKGKHTAVAYARTAEHATAVAWSFRVR